MIITGLTSSNSDNYIWVIQSETSHEAWVVDPGESYNVLTYFKKHNLTLSGILLTHHHYDHTDGIDAIITELGEVPIVSNSLGPYKQVTKPVLEGDVLTILGHKFKVISIPGHSHEHVAFYNPKALFCGDVLFTAGCGKAWCQSSKVMAESLLKLRDLDDDCLVYCGHEYTSTNINFAAVVEPQNQAIIQRQKSVWEKTMQGLPCVPEKLGIEKKTNPFLKFDSTTIKPLLLNRNEVYENFTPDENGNLYATLREWKNKLDKTGELEKQP